MTMLFLAKMGDLTLLSGQPLSRVVKVKEECYDAEAFTIIAPLDVDSKTYTIEVSDDGVNYSTLQDVNAVDIKVPVAGKAISYNGILTAFEFFRLRANANLTQNISFAIRKSFRA